MSCETVIIYAKEDESKVIVVGSNGSCDALQIEVILLRAEVIVLEDTVTALEAEIVVLGLDIIELEQDVVTLTDENTILKEELMPCRYYAMAVDLNYIVQ